MFENIYFENYNSLISGTSLTEVSDISNFLKKVWKKICDFFKMIVDKIKNLIYGRVKNLNITKVKNSTTNVIKVEFYANFKKFYEIEINKRDTVKLTNIFNVHNILKVILKHTTTINFDEEFEYGDDVLNEGKIDKGDIDALFTTAFASINDKDFNDQFNSDLNNIKSNEVYILYSVIRDNVFTRIKADDATFETVLDNHIKNINTYYMKCVDMINKVGHSAIKKMKKTPGKKSFKIYTVAKEMTKVALRAKSLIQIDDDF